MFKNLPLSVCGVMLALLSLGNLINRAKYLFLTVALVILFLIIFKFIKYLGIVKNELSNVIGLSSFATFSMSLMLLSNYFTSQALWYAGIIVHIIIMIVFTKKFVFDDFKMENVHGSWWIVYVGITMAAITAPAVGMANYGYIFVIFGFAAMFLTFTLVTYRYIKYPLKDDKEKPLMCIYAAVFAILLVGYINAYDFNKHFLILIYIIAFVLYIFALYKLITFKGMDFKPTFAAFTFPFVISAIATKNMVNIFKINGLQFIFHIQMAIAMVLVIGVLYLFYRNSFRSITR